jgi:hypothetical protein
LDDRTTQKKGAEGQMDAHRNNAAKEVTNREREGHDGGLVRDLEQIAKTRLGKDVVKKRAASKMERRVEFLQSGCFAVEWRGSLLLDKEVMLESLEAVVGRGSGVSYCVGAQYVEGSAHYLAVVRTRRKDRVRVKKPRRRLVAGHVVGRGVEEDTGDFGFAMCFPGEHTDAALNDFVGKVARLCDTFDQVWTRNEDQLMDERDMSFLRPGRSIANEVERALRMSGESNSTGESTVDRMA